MKSDNKDKNVTFYSSKFWKINIKVSANILSSTAVFNIDNNSKYFLSSKSAYYVISEGSCDTEDWSNDAENSALHHRNTLHFKIWPWTTKPVLSVNVFRN